MTDPAKKKRVRNIVFLTIDIPPKVLGITKDAKCVLVYLLNRLNTNRAGTECWPAVSTIGTSWDMSDSTVRRHTPVLERAGLIKCRQQSGRSNVYTINVELIRQLGRPWSFEKGIEDDLSNSDPCQSDRGKQADPCQSDGGTPVRVTGDPCQSDGVMANRTAYPNGKYSSFAIRANPRVGDGDEQRKLEIHQVIGGTAAMLRSPILERPTEKKPNEAREEALRLTAGLRKARERPG